MNKNGVTLVEFTFALIIGSILVLVMTCQFVAWQKGMNIIRDQIDALNAASMVIHTVTRFIRVADPDSINTNPIPPHIVATIQPGYLNDITSPTTFTFSWQSGAHRAFVWNNETTGGSHTIVAGDNTTGDAVVTEFIATKDPNWASGTHIVTLKVTAQRGSQTCSLETRIFVLPKTP